MTPLTEKKQSETTLGNPMEEKNMMTTDNTKPRVSKLGRYSRSTAYLALSTILLSAGGALADDLVVGDGITDPVVLPAFNPNAPLCSAPEGLTNVLALAQDNDRTAMLDLDHGLRLAAEDRGLEYRVAVANSDAAKIVEQTSQFLAQKVGALVSTPVDPAGQAFALQELIKSGAYVGNIVVPPATLFLNAPQYQTGQLVGEAAAEHIETVLGGEANVVIFTQDSVEFVRPRFTAMRDALADLPGVTIVADFEPRPPSKDGGFQAMNTILQANPEVDVVLGADTVVLGALAALEAAGNARPDQFLGGVDGDPEAVAAIQTEGSPYKASVALSFSVFGYAMGQYAADWLEGKSVPQAMDVLPFALTAENIPQYQADQENPASVWADPARRDVYLSMYGNICYDTRDQYVNFPWSSESEN
ncbi:MAG: sugar ABC transporter substrate-binding protein [Pseudomonadota bacterium]